jgi:hypothetical protein
LAALRAPVFLGSLTRKKGAVRHGTRPSQLCSKNPRKIPFQGKIRKSVYSFSWSSPLQLQVAL